MGIPILELVKGTLEGAGFAAAAAYPGQKLPQISGPVAAYHIHSIDGEANTVTVEICILAPGSQGGSSCEVAALRATAALQTVKASCVQHGCTYDAGGQLYCVSILAAFPGSAGEEDCQMDMDFVIRIDEAAHPWATAFSAELLRKQTVEYAARDPVAQAITSGSYYWSLTLEEFIPRGFDETAESSEEFQLQVTRGDKAELYAPCRWQSVKRNYTQEGLRLIRKGIALSRTEVD